VAGLHRRGLDGRSGCCGAACIIIGAAAGIIIVVGTP